MPAVDIRLVSEKQMIVIEPISSTKDEESIAKALKVPDSSQIKILDRLRSSVKLSCNQLFLDVFKVVDH
uniref:hypothetical protein n=1 Tax=Faecalibaculum rodentium TaxID=1702221 RepID=UPI0023EFD587